jgi:hypothetical protein
VDAEERRARQREYNRQYRAANLERIQARERTYKKLNPERVREQGRKYREANREKVREQQRQWREANPERTRELNWRWRATNLPWQEGNAKRVQELDRQLRAHSPEGLRVRNLLAKHRLQPEDWAAMWIEQDSKCYLCGGELDAEKKHAYRPRPRLLSTGPVL